MKRLGFDLILLGAPASGKNTQAVFLMKKYKLKPVESGKYWRKLLKDKTRIGAWVRRTTGIGRPAPIPLMKKFLLDQVKNLPKDRDLIFIGNPRLKPEAQLLNKLLQKQKHEYLVLYINIPVKDVYTRSLYRIRVQGEDRPEYIKNRLDYHKKQVSKTVKYFKMHKKLVFINGKQNISKVSKDIQQAINDYQKSLGN
ncbi:MAG TPA: nucleoside monophosphate kinase [Verrucomicrobiae bacterium]|nr:nucleoside monophosphate kinase [Verrucomicrobiae bacterium]